MNIVNQDNNKVSKCVIITGMSGAGKSATLNILEDQGLFAIDNIPPSLLPQLLNVLSRHRAAVQNGVVAVVDVRGGSLLSDFVSVLDILRSQLKSMEVIFLDASDDILVRRFSETRRNHPLGQNLPVLEGINMERRLLSPILETADIVLDTSNLTLRELRDKLMEQFGKTSGRPALLFTSFGFKYGVPQDCDYIFDVRFLPNPHYIPELKHLSGQDAEVRKYIRSFPETDVFLEKLIELLDYIVPLYGNTGKPQLHFAIGCTGGRHRSVSVAEWLGDYYDSPGFQCAVKHRDIDREQVL